MPGKLVENVSDTAFWIAYYRAVETDRPDALFHDPLARVLAGDRGKNIAKTMPFSFWTRWSVVIRTCIIDDFIRSAVAGGIDTILNLGAGLDTRPYRMTLPQSLVWIEADQPQIIEYKEETLSGAKPRCRLERVPLDLANVAERASLFASIAGRAGNMAVLTEGVVPYLSEDSVSVLAADIGKLRCARYWIVDYFSPELARYRKRRSMTRKMRNAPFRFTPKDWFAFFLQNGWRPKEIRYLAEEGLRWGRPIHLPLPIKASLAIRMFFSSAKQRAAIDKAAGYVLLEPVASNVAQARE